MNGPPLLAVRHLSKSFGARRIFHREPRTVVADVSFDIVAGRTLGLVGESGSGKSTIARAVTMLSPPTSGSVKFENQELTTLDAADLRSVRRQMQPIFQDPYASLNPRMTVGETVAEPLIIHGTMARTERRDYVAELFRKVGLDPSLARRYPHQFSGGQRQRIAIARAIALHPRLIIADEPISSLDVSVQAQVINLLLDLQEEMQLTYLFISHDLSIVRYLSHDVIVLYRGRIVEMGPTETLYEDPVHPYTRLLLSSVPIPDPAEERARPRVAELPRLPEGDGTLTAIGPNHWVAPW